MQLTRTNAVFSRIALVSRFFAESQSFRKIPEKFQKFYFSRRPTEPEDEARRVHRGTTRTQGAGGPLPRPGVVWPPCVAPSAPLRTTKSLWPKNFGGNRRIFQKPSRAPPPSKTLFRGSETPFWHPAGTGNWRRSSPSSSPTPLHQPSMIPPSMCE